MAADGDSEPAALPPDKDLEEGGIAIRGSSARAPPPDRELAGSWPRSLRRSMETYSRSPSRGRQGRWPQEPPSGSQGGSCRRSSESSGAASPLLNGTAEDEASSPREEGKAAGDGRGSFGSAASMAARLEESEDDEAGGGGEVKGSSGFLQATFNGINVLAGVGILSTPYATAQAGWLGLGVLMLFGGISCFTGLLLRDCIESGRHVATYPDIGQAAFGRAGRWLTAALLYGELYAVSVELLILEGDNLAYLFPAARVALGGGLTLTPHQAFVVLAALCVLPTVWLRDLSVLAYISAFGVLASLLIVLAVAWIGAADVGFLCLRTGALFRWQGLPAAVGLYGFCFSGHAVFPNIYTSMKRRELFTWVLVASFVLCGLLYGGIAALGYAMFGGALQSQVTLNLPSGLLASKAAIWTTVVNPLTKFALMLTPMAMAIEELLPASLRPAAQLAAGTAVRTLLVLGALVVALCVPFFGYVMAFIGSLLSLSLSVILPCAFYLKLMHGKLPRWKAAMCVSFMAVATAALVAGTCSAVAGIAGGWGGAGASATWHSGSLDVPSLDAHMSALPRLNSVY